jgi:predicted nucleotidyltransferase
MDTIEENNPKLEQFKQKRVEGTKYIRNKIVSTFSEAGALAIHQFGSLTKGKEDALSDSDIWITFEDVDAQRAIDKRGQLYSAVADVILTNEAPQNAPDGGIYTMAIHETANGLYHVDYYLVPKNKSKILPGSLVIYGDDSLPREDWFTEQLERHIPALNTPNARVTDLICLSFIGIKYVAREGKPFLEYLAEQYDKNRQVHFPQLQPIENNYDFNTIRFILNQHQPFADNQQKIAIEKVKKYLSEVEEVYGNINANERA